MESPEDRRKVAFDTLKRYGTKWVVLAAMRVDMARNGVEIPDEIDDELRMSHVKIGSGCFLTCEVGCTLSKLEADLISHGCVLGEAFLRQCTRLLGQAMQGQIDPKRMSQTPALKPVENDCVFLTCRCEA